MKKFKITTFFGVSNLFPKFCTLVKDILYKYVSIKMFGFCDKRSLRYSYSNGRNNGYFTSHRNSVVTDVNVQYRRIAADAMVEVKGIIILEYEVRNLETTRSSFVRIMCLICWWFFFFQLLLSMTHLCW